MSTRFIYVSDDPAGEYTGDHCGIGVSRNGNLVINSDGNKRSVMTAPSGSGAGVLAAADGAISPTAGVVYITKTSAAVMTLASPTLAQEGMTLAIRSKSKFAHTVTVTAGFGGGGTASDVATFAPFNGAGLTLQAVNGEWWVQSSVGVTIA